MNITYQNISFFPGPITNKVPSEAMSLPQVCEILVAEKYKLLCSVLRESADKKALTAAKKKLDYVTFGATFSQRHLDGLVAPSGYIIMDFDDLPNPQEIKQVLSTDAYFVLVFISPSGKGIKALLHISEQEFKKAFIDISLYCQQQYGLVPDVSGSDITRACFLSYDPEYYYNPEAKSYTIKGLAPIKPERKFDPSKKVNISHLEYVVRQLVDNGIDITQNYSTEWLMVGFSMATYGEAGRAYFHELSSVNAAYDADLTDKKFDNLLKTTRFTSPAKFFSIAADYGADIKIPKASGRVAMSGDSDSKAAIHGGSVTTVSSSEVENSKADMHGGSDSANNTSKKTKTKKIVKNDNTEEEDHEEKFRTVYYFNNPPHINIRIGRQFKRICDILIYIKYKTKDERDELTWVLEGKINREESVFIEVSHDDFCSASKLKRAFASESISLRITDSELSELHGYLFDETEFDTALKVVRFGWNAETECYLFSNLVWHNGQLITPDEFGIIKAKNMYLSVPNPKSIMKKRHELTDFKIDFGTFVKLYHTAHGYELSLIPLCFYMFSVFRDIAVKEKSFSPILFLKGGAGTGKSSMVRVLTAAFGRKQEGVNLKNKNTEAALVKIMSQTSNAITWFDEFHNEFPYEGILQAAYDNDGYHRSSDTNSIDTNSVDLYSALALTSNYLPENPIFFSRCLFVPIVSNQKTQEQRTAFYELEKMLDNGLGCLTVDLLQYRADIVENFVQAYKNLFEAFRADFKHIAVAERLLTNMSQVMTIPYILAAVGRINITNATGDQQAIMQEFIRIGSAAIERQHRIMIESKAIAEFWEIIQGMYETGFVQEETHFKFSGHSGSRYIQLNFPKLYNLFAPKYRQVFMKSPPDRDTIQTEMALADGFGSWEDISKPIRFMNDNEGSNQSKTVPVRGSAIISYDKIMKEFGVNFETRKGDLNRY
jgi:hypothetical protein